MKNLKGFNVKYLGATNTKGSRCQITDNLRGTKIILSWNYKYSNVLDLASAYFNEKGLNIIGFTEGKNDYTVLTEDFSFELTK